MIRFKFTGSVSGPARALREQAFTISATLHSQDRTPEQDRF
jgi:hypothetical protein